MIPRILIWLVAIPVPAFSQVDTTGFRDPGVETETVLIESSSDAVISRTYSTGLSVTVPDSLLKAEHSWQQVVARLPGADFRDYGGTAGLKTVTSRGTTSSQNVVLLDGMIMNDALTGVANFGLLHPSFLNSITFRSGGFSADAGQGSLGSVAYLEMDRGKKEAAGLKLSAGSFQNRMAEANYQTMVGSFSVKLAGHYTNSTGKFTYPDPATRAETERIHNEGKTTGLMISAGSLVGSFHWNSTVSVMNQDQNVPGPVILNNPFPAVAHLSNRDRWWLPVFHTTIADRSFRFSGLVRQNISLYSDPSIPTGKSEWNQDEQSARIDWSATDKMSTGVFIRNQRGTATLWKGKPDQLNQDRLSGSAFTGFDFEWIRLQGRVESAQNLPTLWTGSVGLHSSFQNWNISLSVIRNARYPSFTEVQFQSARTRLIPENYTGLEPELSWQSATWQVSFRGFLYRISNKVVGIPQNPVIWSTYNAGSVIGSGLDASLTKTAGAWKTWIHSTIQSVKLENQKESVLNGKDLVYTPRFSGAGGVSYEWNDFNLELNGQFTGRRFTGPENLPWDTLSEFGILNGRISYLPEYWQRQLSLALFIQNITDQDYELVKSYPVAGRSLLLELSYIW